MKSTEECIEFLTGPVGREWLESAEMSVSPPIRRQTTLMVSAALIRSRFIDSIEDLKYLDLEKIVLAVYGPPPAPAEMEFPDWEELWPDPPNDQIN